MFLRRLTSVRFGSVLLGQLWLRVVWLGMPLLVGSGCSVLSSPEPPTRSERALHYERVLASDIPGQRAAALRFFAATDDQGGQYRAWLQALRRAETDAERQAAAQQLMQLAQALDEPEYVFVAAANLWVLTEPAAAAQRARYADLMREYARTWRDEAVTAALLGEQASLLKQLQTIEHLSVAKRARAADSQTLGFLYWRAAWLTRDPGYALQALAYYRLGSDFNGVVDALFLAAQLSTDPEAALRLAQRAQLAASNAGLHAKHESITRWLAAQTFETQTSESQESTAP